MLSGKIFSRYGILH